ncbi:hypothetical protein VPH35_123347 [Triticum aestivum]
MVLCGRMSRSPHYTSSCNGVRAHYVAEGHVLRFKLVESDMLFINVFGRSGARLGYCVESSSDDESSSSSDSDEEDTDGEDSDGEPRSSSMKTMTRTPIKHRAHRHRRLGTSITSICS